MRIFASSLTSALLFLSLVILCPISGQVYQVNDDTNTPVVLAERVTFKGLPLDITLLVGTSGVSEIAVIGNTNTCKASLYALDTLKRTATVLIADGDPRLNTECGFGWVRVSNNMIYFGTSSPTRTGFPTLWKYDLTVDPSTGKDPLTQLLGYNQLITVKRADGSTVIGRAWYASIAQPSFGNTELCAEVVLVDPSYINPTDMTKITYVSVVRLDDGSYAEKIANMHNLNIGGLPIGFLQTKYGFATAADGSINIIAANNNSQSYNNMAIVNYKPDGSYTTVVKVGAVDGQGQIIRSWSFGNSYAIDPITGKIILNYNTDNGSFEVYLDGTKFVALFNLPLPVGGVLGVATFSNNTPYAYAKIADNGGASDALVGPNGDIRKFNIREQLPDGTWVMHTKSPPRDDSARLVAGRQ